MFLRDRHASILGVFPAIVEATGFVTANKKMKMKLLASYHSSGKKKHPLNDGFRGMEFWQTFCFMMLPRQGNDAKKHSQGKKHLSASRGEIAGGCGAERKPRGRRAPFDFPG